MKKTGQSYENIKLPFRYRRFFDKPGINKECRINGIGGDEWMHPGIVNRPNGTGDWLLMFFATPVTLGEIGGNALQDCECAILWPPEAGHYYGNLERRWCHSWIHFQGDLFRQMAKMHSITLQKATKVDYSGAVRQIDSLAAELFRHHDYSSIICRNIIENLFIELERSGKTEVAISERILKARDFIEKNYVQPLTLQMLARRSCLSIPHFSAEFKKAFAVSPIAYLLELRLRNSCYLLMDQNLTLTEVAKRCGFNDPFYFSRMFRQRYNVPPSIFRRKH